MTELCDVIHFMRLGGELYKLTGDSSYLDYFELAFVNPFMAGVTRDGSWGARVCVGPSLLALSRDFGAPTDEIRKNHFLCTDGVSATAIAVEHDGDAAVFDVTFTVGDESFSLRMCNFASAADFLEYMDYRYTVFI